MDALNSWAKHCNIIQVAINGHDAPLRVLFDTRIAMETHNHPVIGFCFEGDGSISIAHDQKSPKLMDVIITVNRVSNACTVHYDHYIVYEYPLRECPRLPLPWDVPGPPYLVPPLYGVRYNGEGMIEIMKEEGYIVHPDRV